MSVIVFDKNSDSREIERKIFKSRTLISFKEANELVQKLTAAFFKHQNKEAPRIIVSSDKFKELDMQNCVGLYFPKRREIHFNEEISLETLIHEFAHFIQYEQGTYREGHGFDFILCEMLVVFTYQEIMVK